MKTLGSNFRQLILSSVYATSAFAASAFFSAAYAQNPSQPGELRFAVYSNSSAEIFWDRSTDNVIVTGYEVQVNDDIVGVLDATSYYARSYVVGTPYTLTVTAIDDEGNRSDPSTISFIGGDRSAVVTPPVVQPPVVMPPVVEPPVVGNGPLPPTSVTAAVYSRRTFEVFWDRVPNGFLEYEVFLDSVLVNTTTGTSSTLRNLTAGTEYDVSIVAIDMGGNRSAPSNVTVTTPGERVAPTPPTTNPLAPPTPQNAVLAVYSRTTAELFWDRAPAAAVIVNNEVRRDGVLIGQTNGTSFYDNTRTVGVDYQYEITAINSSGTRSGTAVVGVGGTDSGMTDSGMTDSGMTDSGMTDSGMTDSGMTDSGMTDSGMTDSGMTDSGMTDSGMTDSGMTDSGTTDAGSISVFVPDATDIVDVEDFYAEDGYDTVDVIRIDARTNTTPGICTVDDQSGCTLDDVKADIDPNDDFKVEIAIQVVGDDLPDDGSESNATLRQRGGSSRLFPQKSYRIKLDSKKDLWRNERRLQLNKHPNERARIRNKISFDLMQELPHLPSLRTQFVNLWIDDGAGPEDYGLFTHVEFVGKEYLVNRGLNDDDRLYKAEFFEFSQGDLDNLLIDENGEVLDEDRFESRMEIKRGDDHTVLVEMLTAFVDPEQSFETVFEKYFNKNNVLTWMAANILLYQTDAVTHNFYLYNPVGSEKLYFLPWDYDGTFHPDSVLTDSYDSDALSKRLYYGYARGINSAFITAYLKQPGIHEDIVAAANELRETYLTDSNINERAMRYAQVVAPFLSQSPDIDNNPRYSANSADEFAAYVSGIHEALQTSYDIPMPHTLEDPVVTEDSVLFSWTPAFDVTRTNVLTYDLEVSSSLEFDADSIVVSVEGIEDDETLVTHAFDSSQLPSGVLYYRVTARGSSDPLNVWQVATNTVNGVGVTTFGVLEFELP